MSTPFELDLPTPPGFSVKKRDFIGARQETLRQDRIIADILIEQSTGKRFIRCRDIRCENTNPQVEGMGRPTGPSITGVMPRINVFDPRQARQPQFKRKRLTRREQKKVASKKFKLEAARVIAARKARKKKLTARRR